MFPITIFQFQNHFTYHTILLSNKHIHVTGYPCIWIQWLKQRSMEFHTANKLLLNKCMLVSCYWFAFQPKALFWRLRDKVRLGASCSHKARSRHVRNGKTSAHDLSICLVIEFSQEPECVARIIYQVWPPSSKDNKMTWYAQWVAMLPSKTSATSGICDPRGFRKRCGYFARFTGSACIFLKNMAISYWFSLCKKVDKLLKWNRDIW